MILHRRPDGSILFEVAWKDFRADWRKATAAQKVVLDDRRPAVRIETRGPDGAPEVRITTIAGPLWERLRPRLQAAMRGDQPHRRLRLCGACRAELTVTREYGDSWTFRCPQCRTVEVWGKRIVGGTMGAGEQEKT